VACPTKSHKEAHRERALEQQEVAQATPGDDGGGRVVEEAAVDGEAADHAIPARILLRIAFDGAKACDGRATEPKP
jgi:hypothetical protein